MKEFTYIIQDPAGIHARPAGMLIKKMQTFNSDITITKGAKTVSLKKLFALMGLAIKQNETITIKADGIDEDAAIDAAKQVIASEKI
ncbi:MAG: HPr family phosphocarrier protein [Clostridiales bacterium]|jgi:phosphocarrier protein|nr:HPr family phosphocarrier protein [Clostridiales bacterium]